MHTWAKSLHIDLLIDSEDIKLSVLLIIADYIFREVRFLLRRGGEIVFVFAGYKEQRPASHQSTAENVSVQIGYLEPYICQMCFVCVHWATVVDLRL